MIKSCLELFLQGGLGNQLIQMAYADSLQVRTGARLRINPVLLHPFLSRMRFISRRKRFLQWASTTPEVEGLHRQMASLLRLYLGHLKSDLFSDRCSDAEIVEHILTSHSGSWYGLLGYFQRYQAFGKHAQRFWSHLTNTLHEHSLIPFPRGQVVAHIRLGDYLWPQNQRLFAPYPVNQQLLDAYKWSRNLGGPEKINVVTDDPVTLSKLLDDQSEEIVRIYHGKDVENDFLFLSRHRHIVGSNSTFSLCAGKLSSELWGEPQPLTIPNRWYIDSDQNNLMQAHLSQCEFATYVNKLPAH